MSARWKSARLVWTIALNSKENQEKFNETQIKVDLTNQLDSIKLLILLNFLKAEREKVLGNEAYKKKDFDTALKHYNAAIDADPLNMSYLTNKAGKPNTTTIIVLLEFGSFFCLLAAYFEKKEYQTCIEVCEKAIELGRENKADFTIIAK